MGACRKRGGEAAECAWVVGKREQKPGNAAPTPSLEEEISSASFPSHCAGM